jgi:pimeloyl-ACP methyl ester carboxylesterase
LPGSGRSPRPFDALSIDLFAEVVAEIVEKIGGGAAHLVGHSMGTLVCQQVATRRPESVKSLTLFGPIYEPTDAARERLRERARAVRQDGLIGIADAAATGGTSSSSRSANPLLAPFVRESHMRQDAEGFAQTCEALAGGVAADLRFLRCPTLIVTGDEDAVAPPSAAQALADRIKGARLKVLEHCGHWTPFERPQDCARLLSEHVRAHERA